MNTVAKRTKLAQTCTRYYHPRCQEDQDPKLTADDILSEAVKGILICNTIPTLYYSTDCI